MASIRSAASVSSGTTAASGWSDRVAAEQHDMDCIGAVAMDCVEFVRAAARHVRIKARAVVRRRSQYPATRSAELSKVGLRRPVNRFSMALWLLTWAGEICNPSAGGTNSSPARVIHLFQCFA